MPYCPHCGAVIQEDQKICIECNKAVNQPDHKREGFFGYFFGLLFGIFQPLLGLILALLFKDKRPRTSRFTLVLSIIGFILWVLLAALFVLFWTNLIVEIFS